MPQLKLFINNDKQPYAKRDVDFDDCETVVEREKRCNDLAEVFYWQYAPKLYDMRLEAKVYLYMESKMNDRKFKEE